FALSAVFAGMHINSLVTIYAGHITELIHLTGVATAAGNFLMQTLQGETGVRVVKGLSLLPALGLMTAVALLPERTAMKVILFMAVNTRTSRIPKFLVRLVTGTALLLCVSTFQRKTGMAVVECIELHVDD